MRKQMNMYDVRSRYVANNRKKEHAATFKEHRQTATLHLHQLQQKEFNAIYPSIDEDTFSQHMTFLNKYASLPDYSYRLVVFGPYLYEHLLQHPSDPQALSFLEGISQYEQLELPQTEELADILLINIYSKCQNILTIVSNLLNNHRYSSCLRDLVLQKELLLHIQNTLSKIKENCIEQTWSYLQMLYFRILCAIINSHPTVSFPIFQQVINKITTFNLQEEQISLLFSTVGNICGSMAPDKQKANIIHSKLEGVMLKNYYDYDEDIAIIMEYCLRCSVNASDILIPFLVSSLKSGKSHLNQRVVSILTLHQKQEQFSSEIDLQELIAGLLNCYLNSSHSVISLQIDILHLISKIIPQYIQFTLGHNSMVSEIDSDHLDHFQTLILALKQAVQSHSVELRSVSLEVILSMLIASPSDIVIGMMHKEGLLGTVATLEMLQGSDDEKASQILSYFEGQL